MIAILAFILTMYVLVSAVIFLAYSGEPFANRAKTSAIAPVLLVFAGLIWLAEQLEGLG
jgi:hypothetical protein